MKSYKRYLAIIIVSTLVVFIGWRYVEFLQSSKNQLVSSKIKFEAKSMRDLASNLISSKQNATMALALGIVSSKELAEIMANKNIPKNYYNDLVDKIRENTIYKNIWVQILDSNLTALYRSWSDKKNDCLYGVRKDLAEVVLTKKATFSINVGRFDLSIKAIVPVFLQDTFVGILEVASHFNSITIQLSKVNIHSVVLLKKEYEKQLKHPFTKMFVDDYYVANLDAPKELRNYLKLNNPQNYFNDSYKLENGYLIVSHSLQDSNLNTIGYFIMFKKIADISNVDLEYFMLKWISITALIMLSIFIFTTTMIFYRNKKQKIYYKNIIDTATNIVVVNNKNTILDVNNSFFKYFKKYKNLDEFKKDNNGICNFFLDEDGYTKKGTDDIVWISHIINNKNKIHKIKMKIFGAIYYFKVSSALISAEKEHYSTVLTDITQEEIYRKELEYLTITDFLTGVYNRRFYQQKIEEEINRAKRYGDALSLVMFDIDYFKKVNDNHGHNVGDDILVEYSKLVKSYLRDVDVFCRIGGEEFMIILPHATDTEAQKTAEKLREEVERSKLILPITISFGVTQYIKGEDAEHLYTRVDSALYDAKANGRNRVVVK